MTTETISAQEPKIEVSANALYSVLNALNGPAHLIRELQATLSLGDLDADNPINVLTNQYNDWANAQKKEG